MRPDEPPRFVSLRRASTLIGVSARTLRAARDAGELATFRLGARTQRVAVADLDKWVRSKRVRVTRDAAAWVENRIARGRERERRKRAS